MVKEKNESRGKLQKNYKFKGEMLSLGKINTKINDLKYEMRNKKRQYRWNISYIKFKDKSAKELEELLMSDKITSVQAKSTIESYQIKLIKKVISFI